MRPLRPLLLAALLLFPVLLAATAAPAEAGGRGARARALAERLRTQRIQKAKFEEVALPEFLKWLRAATGHNFVLDLAVLKKAGVDPAEITFTAELADVTVATLLGLALEPHDLAAVVSDNLVKVTTRAASLGKPITRLYGISHITWTKVDFIGPDINLRPSDFTPIEEYEPERVVENDPLDNGDAVAELLRMLVEPDGWDEDGWNIAATDRYLVIRAPRTVHARIPAALARIAAMK